MIKLKHLLEGVSIKSKNLIQKLKSNVASAGGKITEMPTNALKNDFRTVMIVLPTKNIDKFVSSLESFTKDGEWYISGLGWFGDSTADIINKTSDSALGKKLDDMITYSEGEIDSLPYKKGLSTNANAKFKSSKLGFIELKPAYAGEPYDLSKAKYFYHITLQSNLDKIKKKGLVPKTRTDRTYPPRVYVFDSKEASNRLMGILHIHKKSKDNIVVIQISAKLLRQAVPDMEFWWDPEGSMGFFTDKAIPPIAFEKVLGVDERGKTYDLQK